MQPMSTARASFGDPRETFKSAFVPAVLFGCFVLQQFGINYHLSFGSVGLVLLILLFHKTVDSADFMRVLVCATLMILSALWILLRYGYEIDINRLARQLLCMATLVLLWNSALRIEPPRPLMLTVSVSLLALLGLVQSLYERSIQVPRNWYALGENLGLMDDYEHYRVLDNVLRSNSIFSEPSYFGMVLVCCFMMIQRWNSPLGIVSSVIIIAGLISSGSALGVIALSLLVLARVVEYCRSIPNRAPIILLGVLLGGLVMLQVVEVVSEIYTISILERFSQTGLGADESTSTRVILPFELMFENLKNLDVFGVPFETYEHFLYTGLYQTIADAPLHNGLLSLIIYFGLGGIIILFIIISKIQGPIELVALVAIGMQNGGFFSYEKVFSLLFLLGVLRSSRAIAPLVQFDSSAPSPSSLAVKVR